MKIITLIPAALLLATLTGCVEKECDAACQAEEKTEQVKHCKEARYDLRMAKRRYAGSGEITKRARTTAIRCYGLTADDLK